MRRWCKKHALNSIKAILGGPERDVRFPDFNCVAMGSSSKQKGQSKGEIK